jgi:pyruvate dehydrogenase complex dehydrogenase (E1) component
MITLGKHAENGAAFAEAKLGDLDPIETEEWRDALRAVLQRRGADRASDLGRSAGR